MLGVCLNREMDPGSCSEPSSRNSSHAYVMQIDSGLRTLRVGESLQGSFHPQTDSHNNIKQKSWPLGMLLLGYGRTKYFGDEETKIYMFIF